MADKMTDEILHFRHLVTILLVSALATLVFDGARPVLSHLGAGTLHSLFYVTALVAVPLGAGAASALAFLLTRDSRVAIVEEMQRGEAWVLLARHMGAAVVLLVSVGMMSVVGMNQVPSYFFLHLYEWVLVSSVCITLLVSFYFSIVVYKLRHYGDREPAFARSDK